MKWHIRTSKYDPVVDQVKLVLSTPNYGVVRIPSSGRETTGSLRDIAPSSLAEKPPFIRNDNIALSNFDENPAIIVPDNIESENHHVSYNSVGLDDES